MKMMGSKEDRLLINEVVEKIISLDSSRRRIPCRMDLTATHLNGNPLDFEKLLSFDEFDFFHDIDGIRDNLDIK